MRILPIVDRELRVAARRSGLFWMRVAAAGGAVGISALYLWLESDWGSAAAVGRQLFEPLAILALACGLVSGPAFTADALSEEKREGTLGLLFLTDLRRHDIVLGKLAASSVPAVFSLLAVVPVLALSLLLGGVSLGEFGRVVLVLGNLLLLSLAAGMAMSSLCEQARSAFALTVFLLFLLVGFMAWMEAQIQGTSAARVLAALSPLHALNAANPTAYAMDAAGYWFSTAGTQLMSWALLGLAGVATGRAWREQTSLRLPEHWQRRWLNLLLGRREERAALRRATLDVNPLLWLGSRHRLKQSLLWGLLALALTAWLISGLVASTWWSVGTVGLVAFFLQAALKWLVASEAAFRFAEDRRSGALELLLTTGLGEREIVRGQRLALRRLFAAPTLAVLGVEAVLLLSSSRTSVALPDLLPVLAGLVLFVWDMPTLAWAGMWHSLAGRRPQLASMRAIFRVMFVPWLVFFGVLFFVGIWNWLVVTALWAAICAANNLRVRAQARADLMAGFRAAAAGLKASQP